MNAKLKIGSSTGSTTCRLRSENGEAAGFAQIGRIYNEVMASGADTLIIDCKSVQWLDAHLAGGYAAIIGLLRAQGIKDVNFVNLDPKIIEILSHHGLLGFQTAKRKPSVIPVTHFFPGQSKEFALYSQTHFSRLPIPDMSPALNEKFLEGIDELFSNAEIHSKTKLGIYACGQFFPKKKKLDFSIVDLGIGFQQVINRITNFKLSGHGAISWAMTGANTTRSGDIPGGLGLKILKEFIRLNRGKLTVISHGGLWCLGPNGIVSRAMITAFPGTAITLEINTADQNSYYMKNESS